MSAPSYAYITDKNRGYIDAVTAIFDENKVSYKRATLAPGLIAIAYTNSPKVKRLIGDLDLYTGKKKTT